MLNVLLEHLLLLCVYALLDAMTVLFSGVEQWAINSSYITEWMKLIEYNTASISELI